MTESSLQGKGYEVDNVVFRSAGSTFGLIQYISDWLRIVHIRGHHICLLIKCSTSTYCP